MKMKIQHAIEIIRQHLLALLALVGVGRASVTEAMTHVIGHRGVFCRGLYARIATLLGWKAALIVGEGGEEFIIAVRGEIHPDHPCIVTHPGDSLFCIGGATEVLNPSCRWEDGWLLDRKGRVLVEG